MPPSPVSTDEFHRAIDDLRRRQDERDKQTDMRHVENVERSKGIEMQMAGLEKALALHVQEDREERAVFLTSMKENTSITTQAMTSAVEGQKIALATQKSVDGLVNVVQASKAIRSAIIWIGGPLAAMAGAYAAWKGIK